jgi:hypothetical protein
MTRHHSQPVSGSRRRFGCTNSASEHTLPHQTAAVNFAKVRIRRCRKTTDRNNLSRGALIPLGPCHLRSHYEQESALVVIHSREQLGERT